MNSIKKKSKASAILFIVSLVMISLTLLLFFWYAILLEHARIIHIADVNTIKYLLFTFVILTTSLTAWSLIRTKYFFSKGAFQVELEKIKHRLVANPFISAGNVLLQLYDKNKDVGALVQAEISIGEAIKQNPKFEIAYIHLARIQRRYAEINREDKNSYAESLVKAIEYCKTAIELNPRFTIAYYNRACYKSMLRIDVEEVLKDLKMAIHLDPEYRTLAQHDMDFKSIFENEDFKKLVYG